MAINKSKLNTVHYATFMAIFCYLIPIGMHIGIFHINVFRMAAFLFIPIIFMEICVYRIPIIKKLYKVDILLIIFLLSLSMSVIWSAYKYDTVRSVYDLVFVLLFYLIISCYRVDENCATFMRFFIFSLYAMGFLIIFLVILNLITYGSVRFVQRDISSPNQLARFSLFILSLIYVQLIKSRDYKMRLLTLIVIFSLFLTILLSGSRGAMLGLLLLCILSLSDLRKTKIINLKAMMKLLTLSVIFIGFAFYAVESSDIVSMAMKRMEPLSGLQLDEDTLGKSRYHMYKESIALAKREWLHGMGYGSFKSLMKDYYRQEYYHKVIHNWALDIIVGCGVFALLLFMYWLYGIYKIYKKLLLRANALNDQFFALEIKGLFNGSLILLLIGLTQPFLSEIYFFLAAAGVVRMSKILDMRPRRVN